MKSQPHWSQQQNLHGPQRRKFKASQQLVKGNPTGWFLNYPYLLHIHSTLTHVSKLCFVPLFFLPLATLVDVGSIFWHLLWETSTLEHTTIVLHFASGVKIQRREKQLQQNTSGTWQVWFTETVTGNVLYSSCTSAILPTSTKLSNFKKSLPSIITKLSDCE